MNFGLKNPGKVIMPTRNPVREFMLNRLEKDRKSDGPTDTEKTDQMGIPSALPGMLEGSEFMNKVNDLMSETTRFGFLVVKADPSPEDDGSGDPEGRTKNLIDIAKDVGAVCRREAGMWGELDSGMFGCYLPDSDDGACLEVSGKIQQHINQRQNGSVTIGVAVYPMVDYGREHILENARKALAHAAFFGPGSIVAFDAVSLNISGDALYQAGDIVGAVKEFEKGLKIDPEDKNLHNSLGVCYGIQGDLEKALAAFETATRISPDNVMALHNAGYTKFMLDDSEGALEYFLKADKLDNNLFEVAFHTGNLYVETGNPDSAKPFLERAARLKPDSAMVHFLIGECCREMGLRDQAIAAYKLAVKRNPNDAGALSALGLLYDEKGENPEIPLIFCEKSVEISPDNGLYTYRLGCVYQKHDEIRKAIGMFEKALALGYDAGEKVGALKAPSAKDDPDSIPGTDVFPVSGAVTKS